MPPLNDPQRFDLTPAEAVQAQKRLAPLVRIESVTSPVRTVAGFDLSFRDGMALAAAVVVEVGSLQTVDEATVHLPVSFPYVPGLLSFREAPAILAAYAKLLTHPDVLMLDGQGLAHPRRFGIACHVGVALGVPSLGAAKSPLIGKGVAPGPERGSTAPIVHRGDTVGVALRTRAGTKPVYVSVGHLITLEESVDLVLRLSPRWRVPEPTRRAHILAGKR
ncbi:MAG: endonuclease V [Chloroflexota bacterium]|nr:endonuclease V [Chloroflexota bacterium]